MSPLHFAIAEAARLGSRMPSDFRRFVLALAAFTVLPPLSIGAFIIAVDPAYVFGSPSWPHVNAVRPYYEGRVLVAKPYQVWRRRPSAVALGSSRVEVGIDPRHPGWIDTNAFNFAMPSSNSYAVMLAFLHAQRVGAPLKQAVVGLDFFGYNINFDLGAEILEARFADGISSEFAQFLDERLASDAKPSTPAAPAIAIPPAKPAWNEALYLAVNPDVAAAIARKEFASGREHYERIGRTQHRDGGSVPADWDEIGYRQVNPDVAHGNRRRLVSQRISSISLGRAQPGAARRVSARGLERRALSRRQSGRAQSAGPGHLPDRLSSLCRDRPEPGARRRISSARPRRLAAPALADPQRNDVQAA